MNQIISNQFIEKNSKSNNLKNYKILLWISILIIIICIAIFIYLKYDFSKKEKIAKNLEKNFNLRNLYSSNVGTYSAKKLEVTTNIEPFVIGLLKIDSINLIYPIISETSEDFLQISPCRFYGPMPNEIGNMCIAGHNYANQTHFAKLHNLNQRDIIQIFDLNGNKVDYSIYTKLELDANDTSCLSQDTNSKREITLVTCNTIKGNRVVIKARETAT